jgi:hypothetical protein
MAAQSKAEDHKCSEVKVVALPKSCRLIVSWLTTCCVLVLHPATGDVMMIRALAAVAEHPECQCITRPPPSLMVLYFKKHLQHYMTGTNYWSLTSACQALEDQCVGCTSNAVDCVAEAMEVLRQEAARGEKRTYKQLAWDLSYAIAEQHAAEGLRGAE